MSLHNEDRGASWPDTARRRGEGMIISHLKAKRIVIPKILFLDVQIGTWCCQYCKPVGTAQYVVECLAACLDLTQWMEIASPTPFPEKTTQIISRHGRIS